MKRTLKGQPKTQAFLHKSDNHASAQFLVVWLSSQHLDILMHSFSKRFNQNTTVMASAQVYWKKSTLKHCS